MRDDDAPEGLARQRLQAAFGVPVTTQHLPDDAPSRRRLSTALRPGRMRPWLFTVLLVCCLLGVGAISAARSMPAAVPPASPIEGLLLAAEGGPNAASATVADPGGLVVVHVAGEVANPGVVTLPLGSRVAEALAAAGGAAAGTSLDGLNLARVLADGEQVFVGAQQGAAVPVGAPGTESEAAIAQPPNSSAAVNGTLVNLNSATSEELQLLPRIGPATAAKIIAHREANGAFRSVDQLLDVPGIGERTLEGLRDQVQV